jgi:protein SCO1/2
LLAILLSAVAVGSARAQTYGMAPKGGDPGSNADQKAGIETKHGNRLPDDLTFFDHKDQTVKIQELLGGKPAILVLAYYRCPQLCNIVLQNLLDSLKVMARSGFVVGRDFHVITVGIDPKETQHLARIKRKHFLTELDGRSEEESGWWFLTAGHGQGTDVKEADRTIHRLADAVGFWYSLRHKGTDYQYDVAEGVWKSQSGRTLRSDAREYDYIHAAGIMILTPDGTVSQYFMGNSGEQGGDGDVGSRPYRARDIRLALVEASGGKVGNKIDQIMLYCYMFDEKSNMYRPVTKAMAIIALPFVALVVGFVVMAIRGARRVGANARPPLPPVGPAGPAAA